MKEHLTVLNDHIQFDTITAMALERFDLRFEEGEWLLKERDETAVKDVAFLVDLAHFYESASPEHFNALKGYTFSVILDYLKRTHRFYLEIMLPKMELTMGNLQREFESHPLAHVLGHFYKNYQNELLEHIELEEKHLFPYAESLYDGRVRQDYSLDAFKMHHNHDIEDHLEDMLEVIEEEFPEVCSSLPYRTFNHLLDTFQADLAVHHAIEEGIFLKLVDALECEVKG
jgi:iron-sulfur cluster repair protein YtfE (RIC family)